MARGRGTLRRHWGLDRPFRARRGGLSIVEQRAAALPYAQSNTNRIAGRLIELAMRRAAHVSCLHHGRNAGRPDPMKR